MLAIPFWVETPFCYFALYGVAAQSILAQFSLHVHKGGLKPVSFYFFTSVYLRVFIPPEMWTIIDGATPTARSQ